MLSPSRASDPRLAPPASTTARRALLPPLLASLFVHAWLVGLALYGPGSPMVDVLFNYRPWMQDMSDGGGWLGLTVPWVYPYPALIP